MDTLDPATPAPPAPAPVASQHNDSDTHHRAAAPRRLQSNDLFGPGAGSEIEIAHGDAVYRLRRTSLGKLILTK